MLPPVAEIYVVWHPADEGGELVARDFVRHFHGTIFTGLISGAVEVYVRFQGINGPEDAPLPISLSTQPFVADPRQAEFSAIVPILGRGMASAVKAGSGPWFEYLTGILAAQAANPARVRVFPYSLDR